ncbi:hypothetical protein NQ314_010084 [Rhamnusium bicolor]|uniref:Uncharacterized protein n=1 Tax=Rhamnusium bicolor TaxID=1586634 RepID=A0AAV8XV55_9CUCU|nr:hypothetical protein NQ314_010084 [Rhamnusium bicolor]
MVERTVRVNSKNVKYEITLKVKGTSDNLRNKYAVAVLNNIKMRKYPINKNVLFDRLHKGSVIICIAVTLYGCSVIGLKYYRYVTEIKPLLKRQQLLENQKLLAEGSSEVLSETAS